MTWNATDNVTVDPFSCYHPSVVGYRYFGVLWGSLVTAVGMSGNILTVLVFILDRRLRTHFNALIVNLAAADLLYCGLLQPASVDSYLHLHWRGGATWCRVFGLLLFLSNSVSILTLCLIAAGRYLMIARQGVYRLLFSGRGLALLLTATWAVGLASFGPLWPAFVFAPQVCTCSFHRTRGRPYSTVLLFFYFFVGLGCVGLFYFLIYWRVRAASRALLRYRISRRSSRKKPAVAEGEGTTEGDSGVQTQSCEISCDVTGSSHSAAEAGASKAAVSRTDQKAPAPGPAPASAPAPAPASSPGDDGEFDRVTRMCFTVFLCFVGCFAPFILLNIADRGGRAPQVAHMFCANLTWLNSCINPILYAAMNRQFGQAYRVLLSRATQPLRRLCQR
ncbi:G-protein coupled receptor 84 [Anguilla rostrata]|uniref:G-protein coupled receptor 84 n=1 Tax=Anguilla rostrata TaxID=7938 RepID=UPI0030CC5BD2